MEMFFLACFVFGLLFTVASFALGVFDTSLHSGNGGAGHVADAVDVPLLHTHAGAPPIHVDAGQVAAPDATAHSHSALVPHTTTAAPHRASHRGLPLLNFSSLVAFLTWFGAAGYVLLVFVGAPLVVSLVAAVAVGVAGAVLVALFLERVLAGERVMNPRDYRMEGTIARVTVTIPSGGVGEIVFDKAGSRRGEAARSLSGAAIPRDTEVVVIRYEGGIAGVEPWENLVAERVTTAAGPDPH